MLSPLPKPHHLSPFKKWWRLPEVRRMTIAVGIVANDGIVVAADTEETSGYLKTEQTKILTVLCSPPVNDKNVRQLSGSCLISGAGNSDHLDALKDELALVFLQNPTASSPLEIKSAFGKCLKSFYRDHIIPFAAFPIEDRPDVSMLMAVNRNHQSMLLFTNRSVVGHAMLYKAVGIGSIFAKILLDRLWNRATVEEIQVLAAYVVFMVKESVEGCGKLTQVITLNGSRIAEGGEKKGTLLVAADQPTTQMSAQKISELEDRFRTEWRRAERNTIWSLIKQSVSQTSDSETAA